MKPIKEEGYKAVALSSGKVGELWEKRTILINKASYN